MIAHFRLFLRMTGVVCLLAGLTLLRPLPAQAWSPIQPITASPVNSIQPSAVIDSEGMRHLIWAEPVGSGGREDILYSVGKDGVWSTPVNISNSADARSLSPQIGITQGKLVVVWVEIEQILGSDLLSNLYLSTGSANAWTSPVEISPDSNFVVGPPSLAVWQNEVHIVWGADARFDLLTFGYADTIMHTVWRPGDTADGVRNGAKSLALETGYLDAADIAFDAAGRMHMVWDGNVTTAPNVHTAYQVFYAVKTNGVWSAPVNISKTNEYSFLPTLAVDTNGGVHVAWMEGEDEISGNNRIFRDLYYQYWNGNNWLVTPQQLSSLQGAIFPFAIADADGFVHLFWSEQTSADTNINRFRLRYSRWDGETLSSPILVAPAIAENGHSSPVVATSADLWADIDQLHLFWSGGDAQGIAQIYTMQWTASQVSLVNLGSGVNLADIPQVAATADGKLHAVWSQGETPSRIYHSRFDGQRWRNPQPVSPPDWTAAFPALTLDATGAPHVVWYGNEPESTSRIYYSRWTPAGWTSPALISNEEDPAATPDLVIDANGDIHIAWEMSAPADYPQMAVYYRRTTGGGATWTATERISPVGQHGNRPRLDLDSQNRPHLVWYDLDQEEILYTYRTEAGWAAHENVSQTAPTPDVNTFSSQGPALWIDPIDRVHVAWLESIGQVLLDSVYYARRDGATWQRSQILSRPNDVRDIDRGSGINVQLAGDSNTVHILWFDSSRTGNDFHIYESNNRTGAWSSPTIVSQGFGSALHPDGVLDAFGRLHFLWSDLEQTRQIFYERVDRFDWIKVLDERDFALAGAQIYKNGHLLGETDGRGLFFAESLAVGDQLVALAPVAEYAGVRAGHTSPDAPTRNWAYRTYLTNWQYGADGQRVGNAVANLSGEQLLRVRGNSPLVLLNLVISLEWRASITEAQSFANALRQASNYLFDATNGQMAIGHAAIYTGGNWWADADIQVLATNYNRPHAQPDGIRKPLAPPIRVGRQWSGTPGVLTGLDSWEKPTGFRTLVHELGHHALALGDSYMGYQINNAGKVIGTQEAYCTGLDIRTNNQDATNATLMDYQYNASEFAMRDVGAWTTACTQTKQWYINAQSDWETIAAKFSGATAGVSWQIQTPAQTGVLAGPDSLPLVGLPGVIIQQDTEEVALQTPIQLVGDAAAVQSASVTLFAQQSADHVEAIDQGFTDKQGRILVLGGRSGDEVRALSWDATYAGRLTLQVGVTNTLVMSRVTPAGREAGAQPYLRIYPRSDGRSLDVRLVQATDGASLNASFSHIDWQSSASGSMTPAPTPGEYRVTLGLDLPSGETFFGLGALSIDGVDVADQPVYQQANLTFFAVTTDSVQTPTFANGLFEVTLPPNSAPVDVNNLYLLLAEQRIFNSSGARPLSSAYQMRLSGSVTQFNEAVAITFHQPEVEEADIDAIFIARYDEENGIWSPLPTTWNDSARAASASSRETGYFALFEAAPTQATNEVFLPMLRR